MNSIREEFDTREEAVKFLDKYNFKKHIPYKHQFRSPFTYYIEIEDRGIPGLPTMQLVSHPCRCQTGSFPCSL